MRIPRLFINSDDNKYLLVPLGVKAKRGYAIVEHPYKYLEKYQWNLGARGYAVTNIGKKMKYLHHFILQPTDTFVVNHKNENKLDNRNHNLELVSRWQNNTFKSTFKTGNTGVRGVYLEGGSLKKPYLVQIKRGDTKRSKSFATLNEATIQRKEWELELFGRAVG